MKKAEDLDGLTPEKYGNRKAKAADIQDLNTRLFYVLISKNRLSGTSTFADLITDFELFVHIIASI